MDALVPTVILIYDNVPDFCLELRRNKVKLTIGIDSAVLENKSNISMYSWRQIQNGFRDAYFYKWKHLMLDRNGNQMC